MKKIIIAIIIIAAFGLSSAVGDKYNVVGKIVKFRTLLFGDKDMPAIRLFDTAADRDNAMNYLENFEQESFSYQLVNDALSLPKDFNELKIVENIPEETETIDDIIEHTLFKVKLNNGFKFSYLEIRNRIQDAGRTLIFLHGNGCNPEELLGMHPSSHADAVVDYMVRKGFVVIIPSKYEMYHRNFSESITVKSAVVGTTLEALEQMKFKAILDFYRPKTRSLEVYGFSHGAWQALTAALLNRFDVLYFQDYLVDPMSFFKSLSFYTDYDRGVASLYNYPEAFDSARVSKVFVLLGKESGYYLLNRDFVDTIAPRLNKEKVLLKYYDGRHYVSSELIGDIVIGE